MSTLNSKISNLTELTTLAAGDRFPIVDNSGSATDKVAPSVTKTYVLSDFVSFNTEETIEIAADAIAPVASAVILQAQAGVADDLATIADADVIRTFLILRSDTGDTITVKHGTGNIYLDGAADKTLDDPKDILVLISAGGSLWFQVAFSNNA